MSKVDENGASAGGVLSGMANPDFNGVILDVVDVAR